MGMGMEGVGEELRGVCVRWWRRWWRLVVVLIFARFSWVGVGGKREGEAVGFRWRWVS